MPGVKVDAVVISHYSQCQDCHLIFQNPRLSKPELDRYYSSGYYRNLNNMTKKSVDKDEESRAKIYYKIIKQNVGNVTTHLDIGCSRGFLLKAVSARLKVGVELNIGFMKYKNIKVYSKINTVPSRKFNLVTAMHILEHVPFPQDFLQSMAKFVSKDGHLVIEVPTWRSSGWSLRLAHLYHFEPDVLKKMCTQVGLTVVHEEFTPHLLLICKKGL